VGRFLEDQMSARTIHPAHVYHSTNEFDENKHSTFGNLKGAPRVQETVTSQMKPHYQRAKAK
jgi:hypothetical protein